MIRTFEKKKKNCFSQLQLYISGTKGKELAGQIQTLRGSFHINRDNSLRTAAALMKEQVPSVLQAFRIADT